MKWSELSMKDKADVMKVAIGNGVIDLNDIKNKFDEGGPIEQQLREQYPHYTDAQIQLLVRSRQAENNLIKHKETSQPSNKDYSKDIELVMGALHNQANSLKDMEIKEASIKQEQQAKERWAPYKLGIEAGTTAAELLAGTYFLTKGAIKGSNAVARRLSRTTSRHGHPVYSTSSPAGKVRAATDKLLTKMDKGQTTMSTLGFGADIAQLIQGDTSWINNAELAGDAAGIIGGTNIIRSTPWFGRYRNAIDTTLDAMGYTAAGYDVLNYLFGEE